MLLAVEAVEYKELLCVLWVLGVLCETGAEVTAELGLLCETGEFLLSGGSVITEASEFTLLCGIGLGTGLDELEAEGRLKKLYLYELEELVSTAGKFSEVTFGSISRADPIAANIVTTEQI